MVEFERYYKGTKLDYALNDCNGGVRIIVEAKGLGVNLTMMASLKKLWPMGLLSKFPILSLPME